MSWILAFAVTYAVHSTVLLGTAWIASRALSSEANRTRIVIWRAAMLGGILTAATQVSLELDPFGGSFELGVAREAAPVVEAREPAPHYDRTDLGRHPAPLAPAATPSLEVLPDPSPSSWIGGAPLGLSLGALLFAACLLRRQRTLAALLANRTRIRRGPLPALLHDLSRRAGVRRVPRLSTSPQVGSALTFGILRPEICLSERAACELPRPELEAMLAHELAHAVRRDPLWLWIGELTSVALFFQPLNRIAVRELRECAELLADDWAVRATGRGLGLARCLTRVATWMAGEPRALPVVGMACRGATLDRRVGRLLERQASRPEPRRAWTLAASFLALGGAAAALPSATVVALGAEAASTSTTSAPPQEGAPDGPAALAAHLSALAGELEAEISALEGELALLRTEADRRGAEPRVTRLFTEVERRIAEFSTRRDRLGELLDQLRSTLDRSSPTSPLSGAADARPSTD